MKAEKRTHLKAIGLMSGTSLDGLDIVAAEFWQTRNNKWNYSISAAETISYSDEWIENLKNAPELKGNELIELHVKYGRFLGQKTIEFIQKSKSIPDIIASHGHTVFHQPEKGITFQLGSGNEIVATTGITTVADFRSGDVALGGQGAPLVPAGDKLLFQEFDYCLNLGGFANISFDENNTRKAFDICPANIILNHFASKNGLPYDKNGELGRGGNINWQLLKELDSLPFYKKAAPKSLGREWVESEFMPVLDRFHCPETDKIRTVYEHIAQQISTFSSDGKKMLVTGGGSWNTFLIELISTKTATKLIIPSPEIVNFKEALVFAFLGVLRYKNKINCLASVTGARHDHSAGIIYQS